VISPAAWLVSLGSKTRRDSRRRSNDGKRDGTERRRLYPCGHRAQSLTSRPCRPRGYNFPQLRPPAAATAPCRICNQTTPEVQPCRSSQGPPNAAGMAFVFRAKGVSALHGFRTRDSMPRVPPWVSLLRLFLFCVKIQRSPPPPFDAGSRQIPRDADKRGESLNRDERHRPPGWAVRREESAPDDEPEDRLSGSPEDGRPLVRSLPALGANPSLLPRYS
jgi:hypothetical protein